MTSAWTSRDEPTEVLPAVANDDAPFDWRHADTVGDERAADGPETRLGPDASGPSWTVDTLVPGFWPAMQPVAPEAASQQPISAPHAAVRPTPLPTRTADMPDGDWWSATSMATDEERTWAPAAHWLPLLTHWVGPLILLVTVGRRSERVRAEAVASLNWEITVALVLAVATLLPKVYGIGIALSVAVIVLSVLLHVAGALEARRGHHYAYPFALPIVR